jgi:TetR/AcrR family transcriptional repressor of uid operon
MVDQALPKQAANISDDDADDTPRCFVAKLFGKRARNREAQEERILTAAMNCFIRSGFRGASMNEICSEAGMSPGALYRYFPSKEAIIEKIAPIASRVQKFSHECRSPIISSMPSRRSASITFGRCR